MYGGRTQTEAFCSTGYFSGFTGDSGQGVVIFNVPKDSGNPDLRTDCNPVRLNTPSGYTITNGGSDRIISLYLNTTVNYDIQQISVPTSTPPPTATPTPVGGAGDGLTGDYYNTFFFYNLALSRVDPTIDFDWGSGSPISIKDRFSIRWQGYLKAPTTGTYTFYIKSDDGIKFWLNNQLLMNAWYDHGPVEFVTTYTLTQDAKVPIKLEYYENSGGALIKMSWSGPGVAKQVIPQAFLYSH